MTKQSTPNDWSEKLAAPFPANRVQWLEKSGYQLPYISARDCMSRLDSVLGPENWQVSFEPCGDKGRLTCTVHVRIGGEWLGKSDGDGGNEPNKGMNQSDANKSDYSEAFKRACVMWRIGRYLYLLPKSKTQQLPEWATPEGWAKIQEQKSGKP